MASGSHPSQCPTIAHAIYEHVRLRPEAPAILAPGLTPLSYGELWRQTGRIIGALRGLGVGPHDRVALVLPNGPEMAVGLVAAIRGAIAAPINPNLNAEEFEASLYDLGAKLVIAPAHSDSPVRVAAKSRGIPLVEIGPDKRAGAGAFTLAGCAESPVEDEPDTEASGTGLVLQTSGTTSRPKTFAMTQAQILNLALGRVTVTRQSATDRCLNLMPLFHVGAAFNAVLASLAVGGSVVCAPGLALPAFFDWLEEFHPTWYLGVPAMHQAIVAEAANHRETIARRPLRFIRSIASPLSPELQSELEAVFGAPVVESYMLTETEVISMTPHPAAARKSGSAGITMGSWVVVLDDQLRVLPPNVVGEIAIEESRALRPENGEVDRDTFAKGWFRTGDLGYIDEDRFLFITGRVKDMINRGGEKISPQEIEATLLRHPAVAEAVAFAVPHPRLGECVGAAVVLRAGSQATPKDLRDFAVQRLSRHKVPQQILILTEIPRGPTGKYQRAGMAAKFGPVEVHPLNGHSAAPRDTAAPRDNLERRLGSIWETLLNIRPIGIDEDFFTLGGDSLLAMRLLLRVEKEVGRQLPDSILYQASTIEQLAVVLREIDAETNHVSVMPLKPSGSQHPLFVCLHVGLAGATTYRHLARQIDLDYPLVAIQSQGMDEKRRVLRGVEQIAEDYVSTVLRVQPEGPYHLCGHSAAGIIAYETAQLLLSRGHRVAFLGLIDTYCPVITETQSDKLRRRLLDIRDLRPRMIWSYMSARANRVYLNSRGLALKRLQQAWPDLRVPDRYSALWISAAASAAYRDYAPKPCSARVTMFLADKRPANLQIISQLGWQKYAEGKFDLRPVRGDHLTLLTEDGCQGFAAQLNACLREIRAEASKA